MFVQNLNTEQQGVLLSLAEEVVKADGNLHELQMGMIAILREQTDKEVSPNTINIQDLASIFPKKREKYSLMLELIAVAYANKEYHENEKKLITEYAQALSINQEKLDILEQWVQKQIALVKEAEDLLGESA